MGADLYYKTNTLKNADSIMKAIENHPIGIKLGKMELMPFITCTEDKSFYEEINALDLYKRSRKTGVYKVSGISFDELTEYHTESDPHQAFFNDLSQLFGDIARQYPLYFYLGSCALSEEYHYFSLENMRYMTNNGAFLTGIHLKPYLYQEITE